MIRKGSFGLKKKRVRNPLLMQAFIFSKKGVFFLSYPLMSDIPRARSFPTLVDQKILRICHTGEINRYRELPERYEQAKRIFTPSKIPCRGTLMRAQ